MYNKCRSFHEAGGRFNSYQVRPRGHMKTAWNNYHFIIYWVWYKRHFTVYMWVDLSASDWSWSWPWRFAGSTRIDWVHSVTLTRWKTRTRTAIRYLAFTTRTEPFPWSSAYAFVITRIPQSSAVQSALMKRNDVQYNDYTCCSVWYPYTADNALTAVCTCMCFAGHVQSWAIMIWKLLSCAALTIICLKVTRLTESYLYFMK